MKLADLFWLVLGVAAVAAEFVWQHRQGVVILIALGIGAGIMNNLANLAEFQSELHAELKALRQLLESRLSNLDPIRRLAIAELEEKIELHKCPECGALPVFETNYDRLDSADALANRVLSGGSWDYKHHDKNCKLREPGNDAVKPQGEDED
jgi:hypothetical protein